MFYWVAKNSKFPADKWRFDKTDPHSSVALSKSNVFLLIYCKLKTNFIAKSQLLTWGVSLRDCVNTEFDWEVKRGFKKASERSAVRLRVSVSGELTVCLRYFKRYDSKKLGH